MMKSDKTNERAINRTKDNLASKNEEAFVVREDNDLEPKKEKVDLTVVVVPEAVKRLLSLSAERVLVRLSPPPDAATHMDSVLTTLADLKRYLYPPAWESVDEE